MLKKYFIKRAKWNFLVMVIPTLIIFLVVGCFLVSFQHRTIREESCNSLESFEESLEASLYNVGNQLDTMMSSSVYTLALRELLDNTLMQWDNRIVFNMIKFFFFSYEYSYSYIHSIYLYLDDRERFLTSETGQIADIHTYYDQEWLEEYQGMAPSEDIFTGQRVLQRREYDDPLEVLGLYYRTTYLDGVIVINVNKSRYLKLLENVMVSDKQNIYLMNARGEVLGAAVSAQKDDSLEQGVVETFRFAVMNGDVQELNDRWMWIDGGWYYVHLNYSDYMNLYQISTISLWHAITELSPFILIAVMILLLDIVIIIIMAYSYTKRSFAHIEEYVNIFSAAERGEIIEKQLGNEEDEYGMILNNIIYLYLSNNRMQMELLEKQHQNEITEMAALQMQINPHFIFNTLQIMDFEVIEKLGHRSLVHEMVQQLSMVVKYALTNPTEEVTLREELRYLKSYLEIQNVRFGNTGITYFEVDEEVKDAFVFRLLLQPLLENCFEHGLSSETPTIVIKTKIFDRGDYISFAVVDSGKGMTKGELKELYQKINDKTSRNIGLTNLNRRLILHYGEDSRLKIQSRIGKGTIIQFIIPKSRIFPKTDT